MEIVSLNVLLLILSVFIKGERNPSLMIDAAVSRFQLPHGYYGLIESYKCTPKPGSIFFGF